MPEYVYPVQTNQALIIPRSHDHDGLDSVDIVVDTGTLVYAIGPGTVEVTHIGGVYLNNTWAYEQNANIKSTGQCVALRLTSEYGGFSVVYMHLSEVFVKVGQKVNRGQVIGKSGNTGFSSGPHLHIQFRSAIWSGEIYDTVKNGEIYRIPAAVGTTLGKTNKYMRYLQPKRKTFYEENLDSTLIPTSKFSAYFTEALDNIPDEDVSRIAQLGCNELGTTKDGNRELGIQGVGLYAKLCRSMIFYYKTASDNGGTYINILKNNGHFAGWESRGYPTLNSNSELTNADKEKAFEITYKNLRYGGTYGLSGKYKKIAKGYPIQNYGYAGLGYPINTTKIESELENKIVHREIISHITLNPNTTRLIGCIGNTGFFTHYAVVSNLSDFPENKTLISSAKL